MGYPPLLFRQERRSAFDWNIRIPSVELDWLNRQAARSGDSLRICLSSVQDFHQRMWILEITPSPPALAVPARPAAGVWIGMDFHSDIGRDIAVCYTASCARAYD